MQKNPEMKIIDEIVENKDTPFNVSELDEKGKSILIATSKEIFWSIHRGDTDLKEFIDKAIELSEIPAEVMDIIKSTMESDVEDLKSQKTLTDKEFYDQINVRVNKLVTKISELFPELIPNFFQ